MRRARSRRRLLAAAFSIALSLVATSTRADESSSRASIDWGRKLADLLRDGPAALFAPRWNHRRLEQTFATPPPGEWKWFDDSPQMSLVARDWGATQLIAGRLTVTDQMRLSRSIRMVVSRVRLGDGRITPFAQLGLGQWRIDTDLLPALPRDVELAAQAGGGFELALARRARLAVEIDYTILYRETHEPQMVTAPHVLATFLAARAVF
jgi:hypothetical protein